MRPYFGRFIPRKLCHLCTYLKLMDLLVLLTSNSLFPGLDECVLPCSLSVWHSVSKAIILVCYGVISCFSNPLPVFHCQKKFEPFTSLHPSLSTSENHNSLKVSNVFCHLTLVFLPARNLPETHSGVPNYSPTSSFAMMHFTHFAWFIGNSIRLTDTQILEV